LRSTLIVCKHISFSIYKGFSFNEEPFFYIVDMNHEKLSIKSWSGDDKPREKLVLKGSTTLSHAELLAILIGSGNRTDSAV